MTTNPGRSTLAARPPRRPPLRDERGMLLVITMIILLVVSTLAATNLVNAFLERSLARNQNNASAALNAAEGGVNASIAWLNNSANLATIPTAAGAWTRPGDPATRSGLASGAAYTVNVSFKVDAEDQDCDGNSTETVVFNKGGFATLTPPSGEKTCPHDGLFLYSNAIFTGVAGDVGYPVITINSKGYLGSVAENRGYREIEVDVARNKLAAQVQGAFTARAGVTATGSSSVDGRNHTLSGALGGSCGTDMPGVTVDEGVSLACDTNGDGDCCGTSAGCGADGETCGNVGGNPCWEEYDSAEHSGENIQKTPWGVMGITQADFADMFTKKTTSAFDMSDCGEYHYVWFAGTGGAQFNNSSACTAYKGILVVHNEGFDPDTWEATCPDAASMTSAYCSNPANKPAVFDMNGNVSWTGVIIADQVVKVSGTPVVRGGIISLASGGVIESDITGNITIEYSCEAVQGATNQGYKTRLGWHRLR